MICPECWVEAGAQIVFDNAVALFIHRALRHYTGHTAMAAVATPVVAGWLNRQLFR